MTIAPYPLTNLRTFAQVSTEVYHQHKAKGKDIPPTWRLLKAHFRWLLTVDNGFQWSDRDRIPHGPSFATMHDAIAYAFDNA